MPSVLYNKPVPVEPYPPDNKNLPLYAIAYPEDSRKTEGSEPLTVHLSSSVEEAHARDPDFVLLLGYPENNLGFVDILSTLILTIQRRWRCALYLHTNQHLWRWIHQKSGARESPTEERVRHTCVWVHSRLQWERTVQDWLPRQDTLAVYHIQNDIPVHPIGSPPDCDGLMQGNKLTLYNYRKLGQVIYAPADFQGMKEMQVAHLPYHLCELPRGDTLVFTARDLGEPGNTGSKTTYYAPTPESLDVFWNRHLDTHKHGCKVFVANMLTASMYFATKVPVSADRVTTSAKTWPKEVRNLICGSHNSTPAARRFILGSLVRVMLQRGYLVGTYNDLLVNRRLQHPPEFTKVEAVEPLLASLCKKQWAPYGSGQAHLIVFAQPAVLTKSPDTAKEQTLLQVETAKRLTAMLGSLALYMHSFGRNRTLELQVDTAKDYLYAFNQYIGPWLRKNLKAAGHAGPLTYPYFQLLREYLLQMPVIQQGLYRERRPVDDLPTIHPGRTLGGSTFEQWVERRLYPWLTGSYKSLRWDNTRLCAGTGLNDVSYYNHGWFVRLHKGSVQMLKVTISGHPSSMKKTLSWMTVAREPYPAKKDWEWMHGLFRSMFTTPVAPTDANDIGGLSMNWQEQPSPWKYLAEAGVTFTDALTGGDRFKLPSGQQETDIPLAPCGAETPIYQGFPIPIFPEFNKQLASVVHGWLYFSAIHYMVPLMRIATTHLAAHSSNPHHTTWDYAPGSTFASVATLATCLHMYTTGRVSMKDLSIHMKEDTVYGIGDPQILQDIG